MYELILEIKGAVDEIREYSWPLDSQQVTDFEERYRQIIESGIRENPVLESAGAPEEVPDFYRIQDYKGYLWLGHNCYPTNIRGWWGGAHPFNLLHQSVVHNGEITSYGTNRRYIESYWYRCSMYIDTEVVAYLFDLLIRRHGLSIETAVKALAPAFLDEIDRTSGRENRRSRLISGRWDGLTYGRETLWSP